MIQQQQLRRKLASDWSAIRHQVPWQVSVGAAFCLTVICCAKKRRSRAKRRRAIRKSTAAPETPQAKVPGWNAADPAEATQEGKGSAAQCQRALLPVTLIDEALSCSIKQLWRVICKPDPAFQATIHRLSGNRDIQYGDWQQQGGSLVREEQYINPLKKNSFGPTEALCIDRQQCIHRSAAGFVVERRVYTPKVPFGGSFYNLVQWCAWTDSRSGKVRLQVSCDVVYTKRWVPAKGIINSSSIEARKLLMFIPGENTIAVGSGSMGKTLRMLFSFLFSLLPLGLHTEGMIRFYKMWLQQLHRHLQLHSTPSQSVATLSPQEHSQSTLKRSPEHMTWSTDNILPWLTLIGMALWLIYQSWRQSQGYESGGFGPAIVWSRNITSLPAVVPVTHLV